MIGIPAVPGFWPDYYACWRDNIPETIKRMLEANADDYPTTCCIGFTITYHGSLVKIWPKVRTPQGTKDYYALREEKDKDKNLLIK